MSLSAKRLPRNSCTSSLFLGPPMFSISTPVLGFTTSPDEQFSPPELLRLLLAPLAPAASSIPRRKHCILECFAYGMCMKQCQQKLGHFVCKLGLKFVDCKFVGVGSLKRFAITEQTLTAVTDTWGGRPHAYFKLPYQTWIVSYKSFCATLLLLSYDYHWGEYTLLASVLSKDWHYRRDIGRHLSSTADCCSLSILIGRSTGCSILIGRHKYKQNL